MKQTLYQILGVDPSASFEDIEIAYGKRFEELSVATIQDPNKLVVLNQAREILSDVNRRAAYDASLAKPVRPRVIEDELPEPTPLQQYGKWIVVGVILAAIAFWWAQRDAAPPEPAQLPAKVAAKTAPNAPEPAVPVPDDTQAGAAVAGNEVAPAEIERTPQQAPVQEQVSAQEQAAAQSQDAASASSIAGRWSCFDPVSGRSIRYDFQENGALSIDDPDGPRVEHKYEFSGKTVKLTDVEQGNRLTVEQMAPKRMVLNTGGAGRRLVCTR